MTRQSAFKGGWDPNLRPFISFAPDIYVSLQGETSVIGCGECKRKVNYNDFITSVSTEASVDSPPGSATIQMSIPDNSKNEFFVDGQFLIIPMMEVEIYCKGYYLVGGVPQYYRIFWGIVQNVSKSWSGGTTSITINCKDILRWWELTYTTTNPAFVDGFGSSAGYYQLFQNQFAGQNPYVTILQLARDAMGDFLITTGSFQSYRPERGSESAVVASFAQDLMAYWQLKFSNIQANLVLYGSSGQAYTFSGVDGSVSPYQIASKIFDEEAKRLDRNLTTSLLFTSPKDVASYKRELARAGDVEFFQNTTQSKLSMAMQARDQLTYEFYCDTTGDIIFKPPFYNLNVIPNKPVSWIQDFDVIDDSMNDSEAEVVTHVTSSGNAFGGVTDWGLNDEITTPRTGVYDYHLLKRYGWRHSELQVEWAGNPKKLFYHLLDWMDRINSKRQNGSVTIPIRPEIRMGFPIWFPKYDSFFYINAISHQYSVGGQATTTLTLTAKRSKFIAPDNIGSIKKSVSKSSNNPNDSTLKTQSVKVKTGGVKVSGNDQVFSVNFPGNVGDTSGLSNSENSGKPSIIRNPETGKIMGFPNVVMVFRTTFDGNKLTKLLETKGKSSSNNPGKQNKGKKPGQANDYEHNVLDNLREIQSADKSIIISRLRAHRYEAGMTNAGAYDYAHDSDSVFKEFALVPTDRVLWGTGTDDPDKKIDVKDQSIDSGISGSIAGDKKKAAFIKTNEKDKIAEIKNLSSQLKVAKKERRTKANELGKYRTNRGTDIPLDGEGSSDENRLLASLDESKASVASLEEQLSAAQTELQQIKKNLGDVRVLPSINTMVRPVSDEFGFEVIGHYRYGRGSYIDRGKLQVETSGDDSNKQIANRLNIQFAPTGGLLTDSSPSVSLGTESVNFSAVFEEMQPEDWQTGSVSQRFISTDANSLTEDDGRTSQLTYSGLIDRDKGHSTYVDADSTRKAKTLADMSPSIDISGFSEHMDSSCACGIGKTSWYSLLPKSIITEILASSSAVSGQANLEDADTQQSFFSALDGYLKNKFQKTYDKYNIIREAEAVGGSLSIGTGSIFGEREQDNILGDPGLPMFQRAASGDPDALRALQNDANKLYGLKNTLKDGRVGGAVSNFKSTVRQSQEDISTAFDQPPSVDADISDKNKFDSAGKDTYTTRDGTKKEG